ncbi:MAG: hypothetical protein ACFFED_10115 [Candidatus Thorarchaeota archaeon]
MNHYTFEVVNSILRTASSVVDTWQLDTKNLEMPRVIGTLFRNAIHDDILTIKAALARMGIPRIDLSSFLDGVYSRTELDHQILIAEDTVDMVLTSFHDIESFGNGRRLVEDHANDPARSFLNYSDDVYSSQGALGEILGLQRAMPSLRGKRIAISWVFGTRFTSPNIPHSLLMMLPLLGANINVVSPSSFSLLNRVRREADALATEKGTIIEHTTEFANAFDDIDGVLALNWGSLDNFQRPDRNTETAAEYREWFLTKDLVQKGVPIFFAPSTQEGLSLDDSIITSNLRYYHRWLSRRVAVLMATIHYLIKNANTYYLL